MNKGSKRRPTDEQAFAANWDRIFSGNSSTKIKDEDGNVVADWGNTKEIEARFFDEIVARLQQGGQAGAVGILQHWVKERNKV